MKLKFSDSFDGLSRPLAAFTPLWAATIARNHLKMAEMDAATQKKNPKSTYHMCLCQKNHLEAVFKAAFGLCGLQIEKCPTLVLKYEPSSQLWIISRGMRSISQENRVGTPHPQH